MNHLRNILIMLGRLLCPHGRRDALHIYFGDSVWEDVPGTVMESVNVKVKFRCRACRKSYLSLEEVARYKATKQIVKIGTRLF